MSIWYKVYESYKYECEYVVFYHHWSGKGCLIMTLREANNNEAVHKILLPSIRRDSL